MRIATTILASLSVLPLSPAHDPELLAADAQRVSCLNLLGKAVGCLVVLSYVGGGKAGKGGLEITRPRTGTELVCGGERRAVLGTRVSWVLVMFVSFVVTCLRHSLVGRSWPEDPGLSP